MIKSLWPPLCLTWPKLTRAHHFCQYPPSQTESSLPALTQGSCTERISFYMTRRGILGSNGLRRIDHPLVTSTLRFFSMEVFTGMPSLWTNTTPSTVGWLCKQCKIRFYPFGLWGSDLLVFYPHTLSELFYVTCFTCVVLWGTGTNQEQFTAIIHVKLW